MSNAIRRDLGEQEDYDAEGRAVREEIRTSLKGDRDFNDLPYDEKEKVVKKMAAMELERRKKAGQKSSATAGQPVQSPSVAPVPSREVGPIPSQEALRTSGPREQSAPERTVSTWTEHWMEFTTSPHSEAEHVRLNEKVVADVAGVLRDPAMDSPETRSAMKVAYINILLRMYQLHMVKIKSTVGTGEDVTSWLEKSWSDVMAQAGKASGTE